MRSSLRPRSRSIGVVVEPLVARTKQVSGRNAHSRCARGGRSQEDVELEKSQSLTLSGNVKHPDRCAPHRVDSRQFDILHCSPPSANVPGLPGSLHRSPCCALGACGTSPTPFRIPVSEDNPPPLINAVQSRESRSHLPHPLLSTSLE